MPVDYKEAFEKLHALQPYTYVGLDGKAVLARDLEDKYLATKAKLDDLENKILAHCYLLSGELDETPDLEKLVDLAHLQGVLHAQQTVESINQSPLYGKTLSAADGFMSAKTLINDILKHTSSIVKDNVSKVQKYDSMPNTLLSYHVATILGVGYLLATDEYREFKKWPVTIADKIAFLEANKK